MTKILCRRHDCIWCDRADGYCLNTLVEISEDGCLGYDSIFDYPEYQETYYATICVDSVPMYRVEEMGKRIEYRGRVFYITEQVDEDDTFVVTDAVTGSDCGTFGWVKKHWDAFLERAAEYPDVMSYQEAQIIGGKCIPISDEPAEEVKPVMTASEFGGLLEDLKKMYGGDE